VNRTHPFELILVLLIILIFRDKESMRFVKHVNSRIAENNGPFHDLEFTYYE